MTDQPPSFRAPPSGEAGRQVAQLRNALMLVEQIAGRRDAVDAGAPLLDECARIDAAYDRAAPVVQRRFDALVAETALWTAVGVEALLAARNGGAPSSDAAARLADELGRALQELSRTLGAQTLSRQDADPAWADQS